MTQDEFKAKCAEAIKQWHDPKLDGPLLVATREKAEYNTRADSWDEPYTEFAATIGHWPKGYFSEDSFEFGMCSEILPILKREAERIWLERQPEPEENNDKYCVECGGDNLAYIDQYANGEEYKCKTCGHASIYNFTPSR